MANNEFDVSGYRIVLDIEQMEDGSYMATSADLDGFLVLADTVDELFQLAPGVAKSLIETMREAGIEPTIQREPFHFPVKVELLIA